MATLSEYVCSAPRIGLFTVVTHECFIKRPYKGAGAEKAPRMQVTVLSVMRLEYIRTS
jgi:hypothetical protein